jgi:hypothetical protein
MESMVMRQYGDDTKERSNYHGDDTKERSNYHGDDPNFAW